MSVFRRIISQNGVLYAVDEPSTPGVGLGIAEWDSGIGYGENDIVLDREGIWKANGTNTNSRPISGNADWTLVGGMPYAELLLDPVILTSRPFANYSRAVTAINQGTRTFTFGSPHSGIPVGFLLSISGSAANNGNYTIESSTPFTVTVAEAIPSPTADGTGIPLDDDEDGGYAPGLTVVPAPGIGLQISPVKVQTLTTSGDPWKTDTSLHYYRSPQAAYDNDDNGAVFENNSTIPKLDADPLTQNVFVEADFARYNNFSTAGTYDLENQPVVVNSLINLAESGGIAIGSRSLLIRLYYLIKPCDPGDPTFFLISAVNQGTKKFTVAGDGSGLTGSIQVVGSTGNDDSYTIVSATFNVDHTDIIVTESIPDSTADGWVKR